MPFFFNDGTPWVVYTVFKCCLPFCSGQAFRFAFVFEFGFFNLLIVDVQRQAEFNSKRKSLVPRQLLYKQRMGFRRGFAAALSSHLCFLCHWTLRFANCSLSCLEDPHVETKILAARNLCMGSSDSVSQVWGYIFAHFGSRVSCTLFCHESCKYAGWSEDHLIAREVWGVKSKVHDVKLVEKQEEVEELRSRKR